MNHIKDVWYNDNIITNNIIINSFTKAGITGNLYLSNEDEKIISNCIYDIGINKEMEILDDLGDELDKNGYPNEINKNDNKALENNNMDINMVDNYKDELRRFNGKRLKNDTDWSGAPDRVRIGSGTQDPSGIF